MPCSLPPYPSLSHSRPGYFLSSIPPLSIHTLIHSLYSFTVFFREVVDVKDELDLNADIVSFKVARFSGQLSPPAVITFEHFDVSTPGTYTQLLCSDL